jgi:serine protease inhibitor
MSVALFVIALLVLNGESRGAKISAKKRKTGKTIEDFHLNLYKNVVASQPNENIFVSPYSIGLALSMVAGGARGTTERELLTVLQSPSRAKLDLSSKQLMNITRMSEIKLANRLYPDKEYPLLAAFSQQVQKIYNVTLTSVDLNSKDPKSVINQINGWVSNQTNGHIKEALGKKDLDTSPNTFNALLLINCLSFDGNFIHL